MLKMDPNAKATKTSRLNLYPHTVPVKLELLKTTLTKGLVSTAHYCLARQKCKYFNRLFKTPTIRTWSVHRLLCYQAATTSDWHKRVAGQCIIWWRCHPVVWLLTQDTGLWGCGNATIKFGMKFLITCAASLAKHKKTTTTKWVVSCDEKMATNRREVFHYRDTPYIARKLK